MVIVIEAGRFQPLRLGAGEHAKRDAGLEAERFDLFDHLTDGIEVVVFGRAPRCPHAEAGRPLSLGGAGLGQHGIDLHQLGRTDRSIVLGALRTIGTIFRASAGLDREQRGNLHRARIEVPPVDALRLEDEVRERQAEDFLNRVAGPGTLGTRPLGAGGRGRRFVRLGGRDGHTLSLP